MDGATRIAARVVGERAKMHVELRNTQKNLREVLQIIEALVMGVEPDECNQFERQLWDDARTVLAKHEKATDPNGRD